MTPSADFACRGHPPLSLILSEVVFKAMSLIGEMLNSNAMLGSPVFHFVYIYLNLNEH